MPISVEINPLRFNALADRFSLSRREIEAAARRAVRKASRQLWTAFRRSLSKKTLIQQKVIKGRLVTDIKSGSLSARLWVGLDPVPLSRLNPKSTARGVRAGRILRTGAFIVGKQVFKRRGKSRLPIEKQFVAINEAGESALEELLDRFEEVFFRVFEQELQWERIR